MKAAIFLLLHVTAAGCLLAQTGSDLRIDPKMLRSIAPLPGTVDDAELLELPRKANGHLEAEVIDLLYAAADPRMRKGVERQTVDVVGQFARVDSGHGKPRFKLSRMFTTCCQIEARRIAVLVECEALPKAGEMSWLKVTGTAEFVQERGQTLALVKARKISPTEQPEEELMY